MSDPDTRGIREAKNRPLGEGQPLSSTRLIRAPFGRGHQE